ncbi:type ISP restriction/modification enzyme [Helicobacter equorum]|uniref:site-specific DNA-methyltransferase (adenine-specific) n=1 Tax=Helicobacter equorum TaxID=361872 RepID=A0A3D8IPH7_9HELI|nr:type ISP restriction/modification enzyme [Helicobacter equorum]RDU66890.1 DNA methyltransferase [Helicobacter equorum]
MQEILKNYLLQIQNITEKDKEHTYRTFLHTLLIKIQEKAASTNIKIIHEPNNDKEGRGAPDFLITKDSLILGYIENKRINEDLNKILQTQQIKKYLDLSSNLILTDYLRFCLIGLDNKNNPIILKELRLCEYSQLKTITKDNAYLQDKAQELLEFFTLFFSKNPKPIANAKDFADALALRTKILKDELLLKHTNQYLLSLFNTFREVLYKELEYQNFCDSFAQTLTYSLFLSRLNNTTQENINLSNAKKFIPKSFPLIRAMSGFLDNLEELDSIKWLIEEIISIINHIDISEMIKELNKISQKDLLGDSLHKDPYLHFYETFLASYDPKLREIRGVYYTPASVVSFIINAIDLTLQKDFNKTGLNQAMSDKTITLLDFATGTGTFLLESFRKALKESNKNSPKYNPKALIDRFYGFEFLIAPYTIAHLKISQSLKEEFDTELKDNESLNITLTNTLYFSKEKDELNKQNNLFAGMIELTEEFKKAQKLKEQEILIITGNPPYSGASSNKGLYEDEIRISYGLEPKLASLTKAEQQALQRYFSNKSKDNAKTFKSILDRHKLQNEKNPKWLLDDYVKFIRFAEYKIQHQGSGIFAFISNNSFLDNPTFRGMRYHLLKSFDKIYILDLHGNARKKETTPSGEKDDNVFDIMQGVSINIFIKTTQDSKDLAKLYHAEIYGKRKEKYNFLYQHTLDSIEWKELDPQEPFYLFIPQDENLRAEYDKGYSIKDMFRISSTGICSQRDSVVIRKTQEEIKKLIDDFCSISIEDIIKKYNIEKDGRDWQIKRAVDSIKESEAKKIGRFVEISYRPFDFYWTYFNGDSRAFMAYPRTEVMEHFLEGENLGLMIGRQLMAVGGNDFDIVFCSDKIVDLNFYRRGGEQIFPLYLYPTQRAKNTLQKQGFDITSFETKIENFTPSFREFIDSKYKEHFSPETILGYLYALLFHKDYREKYIDFLKVDFPKIPFVESKELFLQLSALGNSLITLHLLKEQDLPPIGEPLYKDTANKDLKISAITYAKETKELFINKSLYFEKVESSVWEYKIGGYQVLDKYLKSHKDEEINFEYFQKIIQTLHKSLEIEREIAKIKFV